MQREEHHHQTIWSARERQRNRHSAHTDEPSYVIASRNRSTFNEETTESRRTIKLRTQRIKRTAGKHPGNFWDSFVKTQGRVQRLFLTMSGSANAATNEFGKHFKAQKGFFRMHLTASHLHQNPPLIHPPILPPHRGRSSCQSQTPSFPHS